MTDSNTEASGVLTKTSPANHVFFSALDGLRAVALFCVFLLHYVSTRLPVSWGWIGVDIFFVLSGFLITGILWDTRNAPNRLYNFYIRRTLRIFPLFYAIWLLVLLAAPFAHWDWNGWWTLWPLYIGNALLLFPHTGTATVGILHSTTHPWAVFDLGHLWSLAVEEQFYLAWPFVVYSVRNRTWLIRTCVAVMVIVPIARCFAAHLIPAHAIAASGVYYFTPFRMDALLWGAWIALVYRGASRERLLRSAWWGILAVFVAFAGYAAVGHLIASNGAELWRVSAKFFLADALAACILLLAIQPHTVVFKALNTAWLRWIGRLTYGGYVYHMFIKLLIDKTIGKHFHDPTYPDAIIGAVLTVLIAWASFRYFESFFIRAKDRLTRRS